MSGYKCRLYIWILIIGACLLASCSPTRYVPEGDYLLNKVKVRFEDGSKEVKASELKPYIRQAPNRRMLWMFRFQLGVYNLSGSDTTKWVNRWLRRSGMPPVIYDPMLTEMSRSQIEKALNNKGYMDAEVFVDTVPRKKRMAVTYWVNKRKPHRISTLSYDISHDRIRELIFRDTVSSLLRQGAALDRTVLDKERQRILESLRREGYYAFNKEYISYQADTVKGAKEVDLTLRLNPPPVNDTIAYAPYTPYYVRDVYLMVGYDPLRFEENKQKTDSVEMYKGFHIVYGPHRNIRKEPLIENCFLTPGARFNSRNVDNTYTAFNRLQYIKYVNIRFSPTQEMKDGMYALDCYVLLNEGKVHTVSLELEGTNSEGDLGFAVGASYQHRNIFRGSEILSLKVRGAYETISGDLSNFINDHYTEVGGEVGLSFPRFLFPFLRTDFRRRLKATTEYNVSLNFQQRPEYTRMIAGAVWKYKWTSNRGPHQSRHTFDLLDINYVYLPYRTKDFWDQIVDNEKNPMLRYSYEDHFIMRLGYNYSVSNASFSTRKQNVYAFRIAAEVAGNLLDGISHLFLKPESDGGYNIFNIRYSQYAKVNFDYSFTHRIGERSALALHVGMGAGVPYSNSDILPFEKRFYSGGANSVRGWSVRSLGPGKFAGGNMARSFAVQCGDIRLDLNAEYRTRLFWKFELALFVDAGNIWTIKEYENQPGGSFDINRFYKEIALAYGLGLRLDFNYFLLRFDLGMKAYNPAEGAKHWVLKQPRFNRDAAFHFTIGYPF